MSLLNIVRGATASLRNHILFWQVVFAAPMAAVAALDAYHDNALTLLWGVRIVVVTSVMGVVVALVGWYVFLPSIRRR